MDWEKLTHTIGMESTIPWLRSRPSSMKGELTQADQFVHISACICLESIQLSLAGLAQSGVCRVASRTAALHLRRCRGRGGGLVAQAVCQAGGARGHLATEALEIGLAGACRQSKRRK